MDGEQLKAKRLELGLTQNQIADELGISSSRISEWENGMFAISNSYRRLLEMYFSAFSKKVK